MYRDSNPEVIWRITGLWVAHENDRKIKSVKRFEELRNHFRKGLLDNSLVPLAIQLPKDLDFNSLDFMQERDHVSTGVEGSGNELEMSPAEKTKHLASFAAALESLRQEQLMHMNYKLAVQQFDHENGAAITSFRERVEDEQRAVAADILETYYVIGTGSTVEGAMQFFTRNVGLLADLHPVVSVSEVLRVNLYSMPVLGARASLEQPSFLAAVAAELTSHARQSVFVLFLPNTPQFGKGAGGNGGLLGLDWEEAVEENRNLAVTNCNNLALQHPDLRVVRCSGQFREESMYSPVRSLMIDFLVIHSKRAASAAVALSANAGVQGSIKYESVWSRSSLLKRRVLAANVDCMPRSEFQDWSAEMAVFNRGSLGEEKGRQQHYSGSAIMSEVLGSLIKGCGLGPGDRVQVRDLTLYDNSVAKAVLQMNDGGNSTGVKTLPTLGFIGAAWHQPLGALNKNIECNVAESVRDLLMAGLRAGSLRGPGVRKITSGPEPLVEATARPVLRVENYKVSFPTAGGEPQIRQSEFEAWDREPTKAQWAEAVKLHNAAHCMSGTTHRLQKRGPPTALEGVEGSRGQAADIPAVPGSSQEVKAGILAAGGFEVDAGTGFCSFIASAAGQCYIWGSGDGSLSDTEPLYMVRGRFLVGGPAKELKKSEGGASIELQMDSSTVVLAEFAKPVPPPSGQPEWAPGPQPIGKLLQYLERAGHVRVQLHKHTVARDSSAPHGFLIKPEDDLALSATVTERGAPSMTSFSAYTSIPGTKGSEHVKIIWHVKYDPDLHKIHVGIPGAFPKVALRIRAGNLYQLY
jgi:hypothetical protein